MSRFGDKIREAFRLVPGDPEKLSRDDAQQFLIMLYGKNSIPKREARKHEAEK